MGQLKKTDRKEIEYYLKKGYKKSQIGDLLGAASVGRSDVVAVLMDGSVHSIVAYLAAACFAVFAA